MNAMLAPRATAPLIDLYGPGIHLDLPADDYYRRVLGEANKSALDVVDRSLYHYRHWVDGVSEVETDTLRFGRALHCSMLEPDQFAKTWRVTPDFGPLNSSKTRDQIAAWKARHPRCEFITDEQAERIDAMTRAMLNHDEAALYLRGGHSEVTVVWRDPVTGLPCKSRVDKWHRSARCAVDLKGVEDASYEAFARSTTGYRYHVQDRHYCDGFDQAGEPLDHFMFVAIEKSPPYAIGIWWVNYVGRERGETLRRRNMQALAAAVESNRWPSYNNGKAGELALPAYAFFDTKE